MSNEEVSREEVKQWVVKNAKVNNPYKKRIWHAAVTIGYDYYGSGDTIEKAYSDLTDVIFNSAYILSKLRQMPSFTAIRNTHL